MDEMVIKDAGIVECFIDDPKLDGEGVFGLIKDSILQQVFIPLTVFDTDTIRLFQKTGVTLATLDFTDEDGEKVEIDGFIAERFIEEYPPFSHWVNSISSIVNKIVEGHADQQS